MDGDEPSLPHHSLDRAAQYDILKRFVSVHTLPPVALGLGRTRLPDKVRALLYAMFLDAGLQQLRSYLESFVSFTTDMGTELGIGDYEDAQLNRILPGFVLSSQFEADGEGDQAGNLHDEKLRFL